MLGEEYAYPDWAFPLGWVLTLSSVICIPLYMIYKFDRTRGSFKRVSLKLTKFERIVMTFHEFIENKNNV